MRVSNIRRGAVVALAAAAGGAGGTVARAAVATDLTVVASSSAQIGGQVNSSPPISASNSSSAATVTLLVGQPGVLSADASSALVDTDTTFGLSTVGQLAFSHTSPYYVFNQSGSAVASLSASFHVPAGGAYQVSGYSNVQPGGSYELAAEKWSGKLVGTRDGTRVFEVDLNYRSLFATPTNAFPIAPYSDGLPNPVVTLDPTLDYTMAVSSSSTYLGTSIAVDGLYAGATITLTAVPEPATIGLAIVAGVVAFAGRRRSRDNRHDG